MYFIHTHRRDLLMSVRLLNIRSCYTVHPLIATWFPAVIGCVHLLLCSRFQAGSVESAVCSRCASALVTSSPSAQTHRPLPISLESKETFTQIRCHLRDRGTADLFTNSPQQMHQSKPFSKVHFVHSLDHFPRFCHFSPQVAPHVLSPVSVRTFSSQRHCAVT